MFLQAAFAVSCLLLGSAPVSGQTCSALNVERNGNALVPGTSLSVCSRPEAQCCTQEFLNNVSRQASTDLVQGLKDQFLSRVKFITDIYDVFSTFFEGNFIDIIKQFFPGASFLESVLDFVISGLTSLLGRATFAITSQSPEVNTTQIFMDIVSRIKEAIRDFPLLTSGSKECLVQELDKHLNSTGIWSLGRSLENLRRSVTGIVRIFEFLRRFATDLDGFLADNLPRQCVRRLLEISFCDRCTGSVPPLCRNSCGALVRGCYAGFLTGLLRQFEDLWFVLRQLVQGIYTGFSEIIETITNLFDIDFIDITTKCLNPFGKKRKRDLPDSIEMLLPANIIDTLSAIDIYGDSGPVFCQAENMVREVTFCSGSGQDWVCGSRKVCTRSCQCWDGEQVRSSDTEEFTGVGIEDQASNPVISVSEEENQQIAQARSAVVTDFLTSKEFTDIVPEGLVIPSASPPSLGISVIIVAGSSLLALLCASNF